MSLDNFVSSEDSACMMYYASFNMDKELAINYLKKEYEIDRGVALSICFNLMSYINNNWRDLGEVKSKRGSGEKIYVVSFATNEKEVHEKIKIESKIYQESIFKLLEIIMDVSKGNILRLKVDDLIVEKLDSFMEKAILNKELDHKLPSKEKNKKNKI